MISTLLALSITFCILLPLVSTIILTMISSYLKNKPLGRQTTYDQACWDLCFVLKITIFELNFFIFIALLYGPVSIDLAHVASVCHYTCLSVLFVGICTLSTLRYLLIFYSTLMEEFNDFTITWTSRGIIVLGTILNIALDNHYGGKGGPMYNFMLHRPEQRPNGMNEGGLMPGVSIASTCLLAALLNILTLIRIEIHNKAGETYTLFGLVRKLFASKSDNKVYPESPCMGDCGKDQTKKDLWTSRIATSIAIGGFLMALPIPVLLAMESSPATLKTAVVIEMFYVLIGVVIPSIVIHRNENMKKYAVSLLCCKSNTHLL